MMLRTKKVKERLQHKNSGEEAKLASHINTALNKLLNLFKGRCHVTTMACLHH